MTLAICYNRQALWCVPVMYKTTTRAFTWLGILGAVVACGGTGGTSSGLEATGGRIASAGATGIGGSSVAGGMTSAGGVASTGGFSSTGGANSAGGGTGGIGTGGLRATGGTVSSTGGASTNATGGSNASGGGLASSGGTNASGGGAVSGGALATGGTKTSGGGGGAVSGGGPASGGALATGGTKATGGSAGGLGASGGTTSNNVTQHPFPQNIRGTFCTYPRNANNNDVIAAYEQWKTAVVTADGAGGFLRIKKPDSGSVIGSTVSEGMGYGMILAVYMGDQALFDNLWKYEQSHLDGSGLMNWEIGPDNVMTSGGAGAATDGDEDMAWALIMADRQWGGSGSLGDSYLNYAKALIDLIWQYEVDHGRGEMLKPGDQWGNVDVTNPSYFAPAYYRVFGQVTGKTSDWNKVVDSSYAIIEKSLNAASGNQDNGLIPAWCNSSGTPVSAFSGAPMYFQNDSTRTPFRVGQDYCYFGEARAHAYLAKISAFYASVGVANIVNGYDLNGTPHPEKAYPGLQAASFVGPAGVGAMSDPQYQQFIDDAYAKVATLQLTAGTIYYQKSWTALSLLMLTGNFVNFAAL